MYEHDVSRGAFSVVSAVFSSLGRHLLCLDENFRVLHASPTLRDLLCTDAALEGRPIADILGPELFGGGGPMRDALLAGERREGWRALIQTTNGIRPLAVTCAPLLQDGSPACDPRGRYVVMVMAAEEDHFATASSPAVLSGLIARSSAMSRVFQLVENLQSSDAPVLLVGERGTGKEVVARAIHEHSPRRRGPFVPVSCGSLPHEMLDSELFGHVRGAFAGAVRDRVGRFELATQGTIFLDEVNELPPGTQARLVRMLQDHTYERVGETETRVSDARVIASATADVRALFSGIHIVPVEIPPLRARREDIEPLARLLLRRVGEQNGRHLRFSPEVIRIFLEYWWPGNVQELEIAIEYAVAVARGPVIQPEDLPAELAGGPAPVVTTPEQPSASESQRLRIALETNRWRREDTARALGISRATLWRKMREFGLL
ncbi:MAG TPA: sigma 54-interacting transcriptional regulator [Thermoanaerobaculia bacterium]